MWWRDATIYQIYPRSFQDSDGVGDLERIRRRLITLVPRAAGRWIGEPERTSVRRMGGSLRLTVVYEDAGDGWVGARIPQVRGAISQGETREQARENVIDALREILALSFGQPPELSDPTDTDSLELTIAA